MHAHVFLPVVLAESHNCLVVWLRERKAILAHDRAENAVDLTKCEAEMLSRGELEKNVMDKRGVDIASRIGSADPDA